MKKNVVFWPALKNEEHADKYGGFDYFEYSRKTIEYWCKKYDVIFVPYEEPTEKDFVRFRPQWQKILFVFDELSSKGCLAIPVIGLDCDDEFQQAIWAFFSRSWAPLILLSR